MTTIYRPTTDAILNLKNTNAFYWARRIEASRYSEAEILTTLVEIETVNDEWQAFQELVWETVLTDEYGVMGGFDGYASDAHRAISEALFNGSYICPDDNQNGQYDFPVRTWQKEIKATRRHIARIEKMIKLLNN